jgi:hypothetical protein
MPRKTVMEPASQAALDSFRYLAPADRASTRWSRECCFFAVCYNTRMTSKTLKDVLERIERWPADRQEDAARVLIEMEEQDARQVSISDSQLEQVKRRRAAPHRKFLTVERARNHFSIKGA